MKKEFYKLQATGNDFIFFDNRDRSLKKSQRLLWQQLCHRKLGIGSDGVILVENSQKYDFEMVFINPDGSQGEMCGNGARALCLFLKGIFGERKDSFTVNSAENDFEIAYVSKNEIRLYMNGIKDFDTIDLNDIETPSLYVDTGVPHAVFECKDLDNLEIESKAIPIRKDPRFKNGTNVDFVGKIGKNIYQLRTYERGVEAETLSCGTGILASAIFCHKKLGMPNELEARTKGGILRTKINHDLKSGVLIGPAEIVFKGEVDIH